MHKIRCSSLETIADTTNMVDSMGDRLMQRLAYRNFDSYDVVVVTHAVNVADVGDQAAVRWYEIRNITRSNPVIYQQGSYAPDYSNRWMSTAAMDKVRGHTVRWMKT